MSTIRLYFANLAAYNNGILDGKWYDLEDYTCVEDLMRTVQIEVLHQRLGEDGEPHFEYGVSEEEYAIHDYEAPFKVSEYTGLAEIAAMLEWCLLDEYEQNKATYLYDNNHYETLQQCLDNLDDCDLYSHMTLKDLAYERVDEGYYGEIPESLKYHIDYDSIVREMEDQGYNETSDGVFICNR